MVWVGVFNGAPQEVRDDKPEGETSENFEWVEADSCFTEYVNQDYIVENNKVVPPSKEYLLDQLKADLATIRYIAQNFKVTYKDFEYLTNNDVSSALTEKIFDAQQSDKPEKYTVNFKSFTGYTTLNLEDLKAIKLLITTHIQICYDREMEILALFDKEFKKEKNLSKIIETYVAAVSEGWPLPNKVEGHD